MFFVTCKPKQFVIDTLSCELRVKQICIIQQADVEQSEVQMAYVRVDPKYQTQTRLTVSDEVTQPTHMLSFYAVSAKNVKRNFDFLGFKAETFLNGVSAYSENSLRLRYHEKRNTPQYQPVLAMRQVTGNNKN
jgi:hypothetical protein